MYIRICEEHACNVQYAIHKYRDTNFIEMYFCQIIIYLYRDQFYRKLSQRLYRRYVKGDVAFMRVHLIIHSVYTCKVF